jgi:hypothetical protein
MDWIELIHLRTSSDADRDAALAAFHQLAWSDWEKDLKEIRLLRNRTLTLDLSVLILWRGQAGPNTQSPLGLRLAAAFSEFGQINHSVWDCQASVDATTQERKR